MKACTICGRPSQGPRCLQHRLPHHASSREYTNNAKLVRVNATVCAICGQGARANDPWTADHIVPYSAGGSHAFRNLRAVHRSCNSRRGVAAA